MQINRRALSDLKKYLFILISAWMFVISGQAQDSVITGEAYIETVEVLSNAADAETPIVARVRGELADACTSISDINQTISANTINITVTTSRPADAFCALNVESFEADIPVNIGFMAAGEYTLVINGVSVPLVVTGEAQMSGDENPAMECFAPSGTEALFIDPTESYCFLHSSTYITEALDATTISLTSTSPNAIQAASLVISEEPAGLRTLEQIANRIVLDVVDASVEFAPLSIGGIPAIVSDDVPERVTTRTAFVIYDETLYTFKLSPVDSIYPDSTREAEALWQNILNSFLFIEDDPVTTSPQPLQPVTTSPTAAPVVVAPATCPVATQFFEVYENADLCFSYPAEYDLFDGGTLVLINAPRTNADGQRVSLFLAIENLPQNLTGIPTQESLEAYYGQEPESQQYIIMLPNGRQVARFIVTPLSAQYPDTSALAGDLLEMVLSSLILK